MASGGRPQITTFRAARVREAVEKQGDLRKSLDGFPAVNRKPKCSGILLIGNGQTIDPGLEHVRWLKNHDAALGYRDLDSGLGISPNSLRFGAHEKPAK
jgi:hypothetical protein